MRRPSALLVLGALSLASLAYACGGDDPGGAPPEPSVDGGADGARPGDPDPDAGGPVEPSLTITPASVRAIVGGAPVELTATVVGSSDSVMWSVEGVGVLSAPTGPKVTIAPLPDGSVGVAKVTAKAGALTATTTLRVVAPPRRTVVAYAWANDAAAASYNAAGSYGYNPAGGLLAERSAVGTYTMTFTGLDLTSADVQVTAYGAAARCATTTQVGSVVGVACYDSAGAPMDARYSIAVVRGGVASSARIVGHVTADEPATANYEPASAYNAAGGAPSVQRSAAGFYIVTFPSLALGTANVQLSGADGDKSCNVDSWGGGAVYVSCRDFAGTLADSKFSAVVVSSGVASTANVAAYAWANDAASASYAPSAPHSFNSGGGAIRATRAAAGTYALDLAGLDLSGASVIVTTANSSRVCNVASRAGSKAEIRCYSAAGTLADSEYRVMVTLNNDLVKPRVAAYAWANAPTTNGYTPDAYYSYNARGTIQINRGDVGSYSVHFNGLNLDTGSVQVTAYSSSASCISPGWGGSIADVQCTTLDGTLVDSFFVISAYVDGGFTDAAPVAYAWAEAPASASYTPDASHSFNAGGGAITASRSGTGAYKMTFGGLNVKGGAVHVGAYGSNANCTVMSWGPNDVEAVCVDAAGDPVDSAYVVSMISTAGARDATPLGYAWAQDGAAPRYAPDADYARSASNRALEVSRAGDGSYAVQFQGLGLDRGTAQVTSYADARCNLFAWGADGVDVRCFDNAGQPANGRFQVVVSE